MLAVQEVEDIDILRQFNQEYLGGRYAYQVLFEGNDRRFIDVGVMSRLPIGAATSYQTAVHPDDIGRLLGQYFFHSTLEVQVPMSAFIRFFLFNEIEGVVAVDFGGIGDTPEDALDRRVLNFVTGVNMVHGPFEVRLHFAKPLETGTPLLQGTDWVTNFTIGFLYL